MSVGTGTLSFGGGTTAALPTGWEMGMAGSDNAVIYGAHETGTELSTLFITAGDNVGTDKIFLGGGAICCSSTPFLGLEVNTNGNARLSGTLSSGQNALYADVAENVPTMSGTEAGDVVSVQATAGAYGETPFVKASSAYDPRVVGVISDSAILTMATEDARQPLALTGLVKVKVDAGYGAIKPGDLLTSSPTNGHAMRADEDVPGTIIGKALEPLDHGTGRVLMLVMPR
ncbi:MAG: hypothetical protein EP330_07430 [Deltaproteobacteria bacterium]|nr:MAG: hypothetical protein EP330_07430 [Deltaproteobacteria bacterium]